MNKTLLTAALCAGIASTACAQKRAFTIEDLYRVKSVYAISVSPDGKQLSYTSGASNLKEHKSTTDVYLMNTDGSAVENISADGKSSGAVWAEDGKRLYFTATVDGKSQVFAYSLADKQRTQLTDYALGIDAPVVSPDGRYIAFTARVRPELGADGEKNAAWIKRRAEGPVQAHLADSLLYRHWADYTDGLYTHLIVFDTQRQTYRDLTPGTEELLFSLGGAVYAFSPDSREICYASKRGAHPEASTNSDLFIVPVEGGTAENITAENKAWDGSPSYSPDGRYIAYRMQRVPGYESDRFRLAIYDRKSKTTQVLTEDFDNWVDGYKWAADSKSLYFLAEEEGAQPLYRVDIAQKDIVPVLTNRAISEFDFDNRGYVYFTYSTTGKPSALYRQQLAHALKQANAQKGGRRSLAKVENEKQLTFLNSALEAEVDIRPSETMWVEGANGDKVQVFIVKPHDFDPTRKYPIVLNVHGGPQMQWMNSFRGDWQVYPGAGYVVAYPNPHGSTGRGQAFCRAISGAWGGAPFEDVMKVTDALAALPYVDSTRMGAMGWSYGGYMMNWLQAQTKRFKCLASMMGIYDTKSFWGATEELWFPNFDLQGQPWNSPLYEKYSPSSYVKNFSTPTLVITGEKDYRVPYTQGLQYFSALQTLGVPSRLIVLTNDGHWPSNLNSMPLYYNAHLEWFHKYLGGSPAPWSTEKMVNNEIDY